MAEVLDNILGTLTLVSFVMVVSKAIIIEIETEWYERKYGDNK